MRDNNLFRADGTVTDTNESPTTDRKACVNS